MIILYLILLIVCCYKVKLQNGGETGAYLKRESTKSIQGIFVVLVLFSHFSGYVSFDNPLDTIFVLISDKIGQLMVTMFLFYSGYGIMESIKKKREEYVNNFIKHRFLPVYSRFFVSVILFLIVDAILGKIGTEYTLADCLLAFTAWTSVGNSTWFMFATFVLYIFVFSSFVVFKERDVKVPLCAVTLLTILYIIVFSLFIKNGPWWYNTVLCFPMGMWISYYRSQVDRIQENKKLYWVFLLVALGSFFILYLLQDRIPFSYGYCLMAMDFVAIVVLFTMKVSIGNRILNFFGSHVFSIYMMQRITYIIFEPIIGNPYLFFAVCFTLTIVIAVLFDFSFDKIKGMIDGKVTLRRES